MQGCKKKIKNLFLVHWPVKFGVQTFNSCSQQTHVLLTRTDNQNVDQSKSHQGSHSQKNKILHTRANPCKLDPLAPSASGKPLLHVYINTIYVKLCSGSMEANHPTFFFSGCVASGLYGVFHYTWYNTNTSQIHSSIFATPQCIQTHF